MTAIDDNDDSLKLKSKEDALRNLLSDKPRNARAMMQLSSLLVNRSKKAHHHSLADTQKLRDEAVAVAERAIQVAPERPFGYTALSIAARDWSERRRALVQAIDLSSSSSSSSSDKFRLARIGLLVRLLIEEREEESQRIKGEIGKGSKAHPNRRNLTICETQLYQRLLEDLRGVANDSLYYSEAEKEFISQQEFRLGQFFRKKLPSETHQPSARYHFQQSQIYGSSRQNEMASFWLATIPTNNNNNNNNNGSVVASTAITVVIDKCPAEYVVGLYSTFAARFDELLVEKLQYQTPTKLRQLLDIVLTTNNHKRRFHYVCDLGCGTGLSGLAFQELIDGGALVGIDLSPAMLDQARKRGCYSDLHLGDVKTTLETILLVRANEHEMEDDKARHSVARRSGDFDLILACDVFCYIGDLMAVFQAVARSLTADGYFCFSTELLEDTVDAGSCPAFQLHSCARFSHRQSYIEDLARANGFQCVKLQTAPIRKNQGSDVRGLLVVLQKL